MPLMLTLFLALVEHLFIKSLLSQAFNLSLSSLHSGYKNFSALIRLLQSNEECINLCSSCQPCPDIPN